MNMKIALIGCGRISKNHLQAIHNLKEFELTAVCDIIPERAQAAADEYGCRWYQDYLEMLNKEDLNLVTVTTPSGLHAKMGIEIARRKRDVLLEKPMAIRLKDADEVIEECDRNQIRLFVVKQNRLNSTMQLVKKAIDKGRFGRIYMVVCNVLWNRNEEYFEQAKWRGTWEFDGGAFMNQGSHYVDALQWLFGPVDYVMASTATLARHIETEDTGAAIVKFRNGMIGTMNITMLTYHKNYEGSLTIIGEKGTVKIGGVAINKIDKWEFADHDDDDLMIDSINYNPPNVYGFGHQLYYENILRAYRGEKVESVDGRGGRKSLEIIHAIYLSAKNNQKVNLPL